MPIPDSFACIEADVQDLRQALLGHPLYQDLREPRHLLAFMEQHLFAVWDFMSLAKALQAELSCVRLPWRPRADPTLTRFVNEIVLAEESDADGVGGYASHFALYLRAMGEAGASTHSIERFLEILGDGSDVRGALRDAEVAPWAARFVTTTFEAIESGDLVTIAASFTFGREDLLPEVFHRVVESLDQQTGGRFATLRYYLERHIEVDGGEHGPMARHLMGAVCSDEAAWERARLAARASLQARLGLWDSIHAASTVRRQHR